jgi:hypothetical protein
MWQVRFDIAFVQICFVEVKTFHSGFGASLCLTHAVIFCCLCVEVILDTKHDVCGAILNVWLK